MIRKRAGQRDMSRGAVHDDGTKAWRSPCGLIDAAGDRSCRQQRRFEIDSSGSGTRRFALGPAGVNDLKRTGKRSLHREGKVCIDCAHRVAGKRSDVRAVGKALRIGTELQSKRRVVRRQKGLDVSGAIVGRCIDGNSALGLRISADVEEPG
ncbi:MAG TPA: hypothetical protein VGK24_02240 [Candidatus Angelobacter sp.]|jgi:hypothetical protein